jgi:DNA-binding CsgD family transcriptional regulator
MRRGRPPYPDVLTPREQEVLSLLREGLTNEQIAERLGITERGARYHVSEILSKLGVSSRQEAARWADATAKGRRWGLTAVLSILRERPVPGLSRAASAAPVATAFVLLLALAIGVILMAFRSGESSAGEVSCATGEAAKNPKAPDGSEMEAWQNFETVEEAERYLCVEIPRPRELGALKLAGVTAVRSHSLSKLKGGEWVAGDRGYKRVEIVYDHEHLNQGVAFAVYPPDLLERRPPRSSPSYCRSHPPLEERVGNLLEVTIQDGVVQLPLGYSIEGTPVIIGCWERDGLGYFVAAEWTRNVDMVPELVSLLESIQ